MTGKDAVRFVSAILAASLGLGGCASTVETTLDNEPAARTAPNVADFAFDDSPPFAAAAGLSRWRTLETSTAAHESELAACLADESACASRELARFRRLVVVAAQQDEQTQLGVVHEYFNTTDAAAEAYDRSGRDVWQSLYTTASTFRADCEDIALAKYFTLRRLGWPAEDLRVLVGWDREAREWHAVLAVDTTAGTYVLDNILGFRAVDAFTGTRLIYSISELGIWDHAPDYEPPVSRRAARIAAVQSPGVQR